MLVFILVIVFTACISCNDSVGTAQTQSEQPAIEPHDSNMSVDVFDAFLDAPFAPADGFDIPVGDGNGGGAYTDRETGKRYNGWYVATHFAEVYDLGIHPGEDWNGKGGGNTDLGQDVFAVANGRVVEAGDFGKRWGKMIVLEHIYYENNERHTIRSIYAHLHQIDVEPGEEVKRRQRIASIGQDPDGLYNAHLHLELRSDTTLPPTYWPSSAGKDTGWVKEHYLEPSDFIRLHRTLFVPCQEPTLVVVDQDSYRMRLYEKGTMTGEYDVSFGQGKGQKRIQGDNRTPKGMYFVIAKQRGSFDGDYGAYFGGHWIKINYPNGYDAAWGRTQGYISGAQERTITQRWQQRKATLEGTKLGGGIGMHGWIREWENNGPRHLSWGCIVMHLRDIGPIYDRIPEGTMVVIL